MNERVSAIWPKVRLSLGVVFLWIIGGPLLGIIWLLVTGASGHDGIMFFATGFWQGLIGGGSYSLFILKLSEGRDVSARLAAVIGIAVAFPVTVFVVSEFEKDTFAVLIILFSVLEAMLLSFWSRWIINSDWANRRAATV